MNKKQLEEIKKEYQELKKAGVTPSIDWINRKAAQANVSYGYLVWFLL